jgi:hypothetical protein
LAVAALSEPETPGLPTEDSGVQTPEALCLGTEIPAQDFGPLFRGVSLVPVMGTEAFFSSAPDSLARFFLCPETLVSQARDSGPSPLSPETPVSGHRRLQP